MSLLNRKSRFSRPQPGNADPAHAFGSEEQLMAEFQRQEYVQPPQKTGSMLSGIRARLASRAVRPHETDAPVYSAETYARESAPDLGWEAAFDPEAARDPEPQTSAEPSAAERFEQFRQTVYSSPIRPSPIYEEISLSASPPRERTADRAVYEEISFGQQPPQPRPRAAAPIYEDLTPGPRPAPKAEAPGTSPDASPYPPAGQEAPGAYSPPQAPLPTVNKASDLQYAFWSGSILAGVALTLFAFVYACVM